jgi:Fic family protein
MVKYIYEHKNWTAFTWQDRTINAVLGEVRLMQGKIIGQMNALGFSAKEEATLTTLTLDVVKSSEIEGEMLNLRPGAFIHSKAIGNQHRRACAWQPPNRRSGRNDARCHAASC